MALRRLNQQQTPRQSCAPVSDAFKECHIKEESMDTITGKLGKNVNKKWDVFSHFKVKYARYELINDPSFGSPVFKPFYVLSKVKAI
ncbi:Hypothetical predicted protein [Mytilus galloprovincialis]|uniref:Uncharacterized protein n=1 Tax=Mytilus galloprovincialis TaxID=29158 RepID=A0A8B6BM87_MYTGA|nr:Hypothetical predicted protein [Mytilus galloprovincialis]